MSNSLLKLLKAGNHVLVNGNIEGVLPDLSDIMEHFVPKAEEGSPRALILCVSDDQVRLIGECLKDRAKDLDLTIDLITDKGNKLKQRNDLFDGTEVIIGSVKRTTEMYFQNGFNMAKIKFVAILDTDQMMRQALKGHLTRLSESLPKCRILITAVNAEEERLFDFQTQFFTPIVGIDI